MKKEFDNEKDFNTFVDKNSELKKLRELKWDPIEWPALSGLNSLFDEAKHLGQTNIFDEIEMEMKSLFDRSKKLL